MTEHQDTTPSGQRVCPHCGYALQPFEEECPRCGQRPGEKPPAPSPPPPQALQPPPPPQPMPTSFENAGFWIRVAAHLIDGLVLMVPGAVIFMIAVGGIVAMGDLAEELADPAMTAVQLLINGVSLIYYVIMNGTWGATLGKMAVGIKIVRTDGSPMGYGIALARYLIKNILGGCTCALMFLSVAFNPEYRGWHDQIVGTRVIYTR